MSLLNEAAKIADEKKTTKENDAKTAAEIAARHVTQLQKLLKLLRGELRKLHGQTCKYGVLKLEKHPLAAWTMYYLTANGRKVAWFKARVVSGTVDMSDDCRGIPFTEARISARFYPPHPDRTVHDGTWDLLETRYYFNGGRQESFTDENEAPKFFQAAAKHLAEWL